MDVHINEVNSTVRATDTQALLSPELLNQIVRAVMERLRDEQAHEKRVANERSIRSSVLVDDEQD